MSIAKQFSIAIFGACALASASYGDEVSVVARFDLNRYLGEWHEIARLPMKHQEGCLKSKAEYSKSGDGSLTIKNSCTLEGGGTKTSIGIGRIPDPKNGAKLEVNFVPKWLRWLGVGWGNYWVIEIGTDYQYAVVSEPKKEFLWVLSRNPKMSKLELDSITNRLKAKGFDLTKLIVTGDIESVIEK